METEKIPTLAIVIPLYNEEEIIKHTETILISYISKLITEEKISNQSFLTFVDDGSTDRSLDILTRDKSHLTKVIKLASNHGHQYALRAGLEFVTGKVDCVISIDADLQHEINAIERMLVSYSEGNHIVYGIWNDRAKESLFKRKSSDLFYKIMRLLGVPLVTNHADFRLLSGKVLQELAKYKESNLFLRGLIPLINIRVGYVNYQQFPRLNGRSKYTFAKMLSLALNGITSFSSRPIRIISILGIIIFFITMILSINVLITYLNGNVVPGWASITLPLYFLGGIQLLAIGIIGEYTSKIYKETKQRPQFHVENIFE